MNSANKVKSRKIDMQFIPNSRRYKERAYRRWNIEQNAVYINFLEIQKQNFKDEKSRRVGKIFKRLSMQVRTKDQNQCKSHHQKMMKQYNSIESIIEYIKNKVNLIKDCNEQSQQTRNNLQNGLHSQLNSTVQNQQNSQFQIEKLEQDSIYDVLIRFYPN